MKAFLLAAGLATRLRPITLNKPKCLVEVCGKPMLYWWIKLLKKHNIKDVIINVHHHSDQVIQFINKNSKTLLYFTNNKINNIAQLQLSNQYLPTQYRT